jgi:Xaa-Pro aminopeptidase
MIVGAAAPHAVRLARLRADLRAMALDALVVSNLPNIRYLTSFRGTAGVLIVQLHAAHLVVDFRYATAARTAVTMAGLAESEGVAVVVLESSLDDAVAGLLRDCGAPKIGVEGHWMSIARFNKLAAALATGAPAPVGGDNACPTLVSTERQLERARAVKDASEVETLREAAKRLAEVAVEAPAAARPGRTEIAVAGDIESLLRQAGFERPAFETIVASGPNGALPHARPTARPLQDGEGVVLDFGGVYDGYCVDLTRTVELGVASAEWRRIRSAVAEAQDAAIAAVRPGIPAHEVDQAARDVLARHGLAEAFGHATGHGIGLEVHEEPRIARPVAGQSDVLLEPGMVFTVEPGAYVEGVGGVRIEDDVLVTDEGCEILTRPSR